MATITLAPSLAAPLGREPLAELGADTVPVQSVAEWPAGAGTGTGRGGYFECAESCA